ncbi:hypothetical protein EMIHUDRAFT_248608 [Emiliania huxleyi CCMP1516]|uniref:Uncharacterized protein n=2 Tax=Emiliania huxleyi TaxID=2903 RepID=A0A0D3IF63_EMIH1|nr:hypothetical protein EMIHUDRAFT_248608 [Emiliania huxleyi CCMP1516]EOD09898.1 hypothetical protein EMIHUDRAFT_248608 [Emiliania huxleyi CCMP1516]|eukprot:XP_005762327.1 hypothetical protein EMIHUDRAFT_248608 [Emiliania huxleyi CCMP1516]
MRWRDVTRAPRTSLVWIVCAVSNDVFAGLFTAIHDLPAQGAPDQPRPTTPGASTGTSSSAPLTPERPRLRCGAAGCVGEGSRPSPSESPPEAPAPPPDWRLDWRQFAPVLVARPGADASLGCGDGPAGSSSDSPTTDGGLGRSMLKPSAAAAAGAWQRVRQGTPHSDTVVV